MGMLEDSRRNVRLIELKSTRRKDGSILQEKNNFEKIGKLR
jgi:hypothetical protein